MTPFQPTWTRLRHWAALVADHEIWPLTVGAALAVFTSRWAIWGLGLIGLLWLARWVGRGRMTVLTPIDWPVCLLLLMVPVTFYVTTDRRATFVCVSRLLASLAVTYGLANWVRNRARVALLILGVVGIGFGLTLTAVFGIGWLSSKSFLPPGISDIYTRLPSFVSDTIHPNMAAGALVMLMPFPLCLLLENDDLPSLKGLVPNLVANLMNQNELRKAFYLITSLLITAVLVLTQSRGGWVAGIVAIFLVLARRWRRLLWLIPVLGVVFGFFLWQGDTLAVLDTFSANGAIPGWAGRLEIWSRALYMLQDFPFTGIGAGTFRQVVNALYPLFLLGPNAEVPHSHNLLLQVGVDFGFPGLIAFLSVVMATFWSAIVAYRFYSRAGDRVLASVAWAGLVSLVGMMFHGLVDATTWIVGRGAFVPWAVMGTILALSRRHVMEESLGSRRIAARQTHKWTSWTVVFLLIAALLMGGYLAFRGLRQERGVQPAIRVPLYPEAQSVEVRSEDPPAGAGWAGALETATFTTAHPIADVAAFYTDALAGAGWETEIASGDETGWGGIYTREGGRSVCLLNAFDIDGQTWVSIVCGDKAEPVDIPPLPAED